MAFAFIIQTLDPEEPEIAYYRFYSTWTSETRPILSANSVSEESSCLFDSSIEKKDLLHFVIKKVQMLYSLKLKQSLIPIESQDRKTIIKGCYTEKHWKSEKFCVVWEGVPGIGFSLICESDDNVGHAQSVLGLIVSELEKYLQIVSYPLITTKTLGAVALIVDRFLPGGQLLFLNSSMIKCFEKQLEVDLQS